MTCPEFELLQAWLMNKVEGRLVASKYLSAARSHDRRTEFMTVVRPLGGRSLAYSFYSIALPSSCCNSFFPTPLRFISFKPLDVLLVSMEILLSLNTLTV